MNAVFRIGLIVLRSGAYRKSRIVAPVEVTHSPVERRTLEFEQNHFKAEFAFPPSPNPDPRPPVPQPPEPRLPPDRKNPTLPPPDPDPDLPPGFPEPARAR
jgi:hypothetical protein